MPHLNLYIMRSVTYDESGDTCGIDNSTSSRSLIEDDFGCNESLGIGR